MIHAAEFFFNIADYVAAPGFDWLNFNEVSNTLHNTSNIAAALRACTGLTRPTVPSPMTTAALITPSPAARRMRLESNG